MKNVFIKGLVFPFVLLFASSCQKESNSIAEKEKKDAVLSQAARGGSCHLTLYDYYDGIGDFHSIDYFTYKNGLVDEVYAFYGQKFVMEYNNSGKMLGAKVYVGETFAYTVEFIYANNKVVKEIWRDAAQQPIDEVINTYNQQGNMLRNESLSQNYYTTYIYNANGSLKSWSYYSGGLPFVTAEYTYVDNVKNPFKALEGIDYTFWYANSGFASGQGARWYSSEKITLYDENGEPFVYYDLDPSQTVWDMGQQNYPMGARYFDAGTQTIFSDVFDYENCIPGQVSKSSQPSKKGTKNKDALKNKRPIFHAPGNLQ